VERTPCATVLRALRNGFLLGLSRFCGSRTADKAPIRRQRPTLFVKAIRKAQALPLWEQVFMAAFSALPRSLLPCDHPAFMSEAL